MFWLLIMMHFHCLLLAKIVSSQFTHFQCAKFFRPKIGSFKLFDKFQVWLDPASSALDSLIKLSIFEEDITRSIFLIVSRILWFWNASWDFSIARVVGARWRSCQLMFSFAPTPSSHSPSVTWNWDRWTPSQNSLKKPSLPERGFTESFRSKHCHELSLFKPGQKLIY